MQVIPTVGILAFKDGKLLLVKHGESASHETGIYGWPGGRINEGETVLQAAIREFEEETGLKAKEEDLEEIVHNFEPVDIKRKNGEIKRFSVSLFRCKNFVGELVESDETIPEWVDIVDLEKYNLLPNVQKAAIHHSK